MSDGPGWAQAATAPSWLYKGYATEGGTRTVAFLSYKGFQRGSGISSNFGTVMDVVPTFLDLAGIPDPHGQFAGRAVEPIRGTSWAPYLGGRATSVHDAKEPTGWELFGSRAAARHAQDELSGASHLGFRTVLNSSS
jgi:arylsulfatase